MPVRSRVRLDSSALGHLAADPVFRREQRRHPVAAFKHDFVILPEASVEPGVVGDKPYPGIPVEPFAEKDIEPGQDCHLHG